MDNASRDGRSGGLDFEAAKRWLKNDVTVRLPGWVYVVAGVLVALIAFD